jgi:acyl-CoA thioester hydrolase
VETWVTELRPGSFSLAYEVRDDEHVYVRASSVMVAYYVEKTRPRRFGDDELTFLKAYQ